jgi:hypothetical protein
MLGKEILDQDYVTLTKKEQKKFFLTGLIFKPENTGDNLLRKVG